MMLADAVAADDLADADEDEDEARADMFHGGGGQRRTRAANGTILARATQPGPSNSSNCGREVGGGRWEKGTTRTSQNQTGTYSTHPHRHAHTQNSRTTMRIHKEQQTVQTCSRGSNLTSQ